MHRLHYVILLVTFDLFLLRAGLQVKGQENAFTSVESTAEALKLDRKISAFLLENLEKLEEYQQQVKQYLNEQKTMEEEIKMVFSEEKSKDWDEFTQNSKMAGNPLIAFQTIRRIALDIQKLSTKLNTAADDLYDFVEEIKTNSKVKVSFMEDLNEAALGILRLQSTYNLVASDLTNGKIMHFNTSSKLTVADCLQLAQAAKAMDTLDYFAEWREQANILCQKRFKNSNCLQITEPLLMAAILEHDETRAMYVKEMKNNKDYQMKYSVFPKKLQQICASEQRLNIIEKRMKEPPKPSSLCQRTNELLNVSEQTDLFCTYLTKPKDIYTTLQRFKLEIQSQKPIIMTIYDVINSEEADLLRELGTPMLARSEVVDDSQPDKRAKSQHRISQTAWVADSDRVKPISKRIQSITGLATDGENAEAYQVVNYGIGGMYLAHYDAIESAEQWESKLNETGYMGNRLVTFILYLSDVELGGATYFPEARVSVYPKKGAATMWYNLDDSGALDPRTIHGGCPVLYGSKWIANKWILDRGQLFRKPCIGNPEAELTRAIN